MSDYDNSDFETLTDEEIREDDEDDNVLLDFGNNLNTIVQDNIDFDSEYPYKVLNTDDIMRHMIETIKEVNHVVQVRT